MMDQTTFAEPGPVTWDIAKLSLAVILVGLGILVLIDIYLVSKVSAVLIGGLAVVAGIAAVLHSLPRRSMLNLIVGLCLGILYITFGCVLLNSTSFRATFMTLVLGATLVSSGILRAVLGAWRWSGYRWLIPSGLIGVAGGTAILLERPFMASSAIALILGVDFLVHGTAWALLARKKAAPAEAPQDSATSAPFSC